MPVDSTLFFLQVIKHPNDIGAIAPSSTHLAEAMTRFIQNYDTTQGKKYLEAGAGTGAFTKMLIKKLGPQDHVDIIEINPKFCEVLKRKYANSPNVHIHAGSILDWRPAYKYDAVVSSLPFNAFKSGFVQEILDHYRLIIASGGHLTFCEYMVISKIKKFFLPSPAKKNLQQTMNLIKDFEGKYQVQKQKVFANLPPAYVHHCQF